MYEFKHERGVLGSGSCLKQTKLKCTHIFGAFVVSQACNKIYAAPLRGGGRFIGDRLVFFFFILRHKAVRFSGIVR